MNPMPVNVSEKHFPPEVKAAFKRLNLPNQVLLQDLQIVTRYFEVMGQIEILSKAGK